MKQGLWIGGVAALLLLSYLWMGRGLIDGPTVQVTRGDVSRVVWAPGWIEPIDGVVEISTPARGILTQVLVHAGQTVKAGDIVATLEREEASARVAQANAAVSQAEANVKALEAIFRELDASAKNTRKAAADASGTPPNSPVAPEAAGASNPSPSVDAASAAQLEREARRIFAQLAPSLMPTLMSSPESRKEALASANSFVRLTQAQLEQARTAEGQTTLRSPISGVVVRVMAEAGELVGGIVPTPVVAVADLSRLQVRLEIDEADITQVQEGQTAWIVSPATGQTRFPGKITGVAAEMGRRKVPMDDPRARIDTRVLEAVLTLDQAGPFKLAQRVEAAILQDSSVAVLRAPVSAVFHREGRPYVRLKTVTGMTEHDVVLGHNDGEWVELKSGVNEGDVLLQDVDVR